jgi:hypothetical protein
MREEFKAKQDEDEDFLSFLRGVPRPGSSSGVTA